MRLTAKELAELALKGNGSAARALQGLQEQSVPARMTLTTPSSQYSQCGLLAQQLKQIHAPEFQWEGSREGEYRFHPHRRWRFDFFFPQYQMAVEVEGGVAGHRLGKSISKDGVEYQRQSRHLTEKGFEEDAIKYFEAAKLGITVLSVTSRMVSDHRAISMVIQLLETKGWAAPATSLVHGFRSVVDNSQPKK